MARAWRVEFPGAVYHVMSRGIEGRDIFSCDDDRHDFIERLERAATDFDLHIFAFCLMPNHYHLFLQTPTGGLSRAMKWLGSSYAAGFNRRHSRKGVLFQGRYKAVPVVSETHWSMLSFYIHLNPVRAGLCADPADFYWSSFREYTRKKSRFPWLMTSEILDLYSGNDDTKRRRYRRDCLALAGAEPSRWQELRTRVALGAREKIEELTAKHKPRSAADQVPAYRRSLHESVDIEAELKKVAHAFSIEVDELFQSRRGFPARHAAFLHLTRNKHLPLSQVARVFGVTPSAVGHGVERLEEKCKFDGKLEGMLRELS